jgi:hypothetical protein
MAFRAYRPESANSRKVIRPRSGLGTTEIERALNYDPWKSVYKQNYLNDNQQSGKLVNLSSKVESTNNHRPVTAKTGAKNSCVNNPSRVSNRQALQTFEKENTILNHGMPVHDSIKRIDNKRQRPASGIKIMSKENATLADAVQGPVISKVDARSNYPIVSKSNAKDNLFETNLLKEQPSKQMTMEGHKRSLQLKSTRPMTALPEINVIGQQEKWLDPEDTLNPAPHSRLINFDKDNLLAANLKTLVLSANEYYPFLGGKCMCGECECGQCKCVHFKYKSNNGDPNDNGMSTIYKEDFVPHPLQCTKKRPIYNELHSFPTKVDYSSNYKQDYGSKSPFPFEETEALNKAKETNIGVGDCNVQGPVSKETKYRLDYPDWKCSKTEPIKPFMPQTVPKDLPFFAKPHNKEYGNFYEQGEVPGVERAPNKLYQKTS